MTMFTRRQLLHSALPVAGGILALTLPIKRAEAKMSEAAAGYRTSPNGEQSCANCSLFQAPAACQIVDGSISPNGWCRFWVKKG